MAIERLTPRTNTIDVLDRVLDKGVVIDAKVRVSVVGLHLVDIDARVIVASIQTYVKHAREIGEVEQQVSLPRHGEPQPTAPSPAPARRRSPARRPRRRRTTHATTIAYRCEHGCTFRLPSSTREEASAACPYGADAACALKRV